MRPEDYDKQLEPDQSSTHGGGCCTTARREKTSRELLTDLWQEKCRELSQLEKLLAALPQELPHQADAALRSLIQAARR